MKKTTVQHLLILLLLCTCNLIGWAQEDPIPSWYPSNQLIVEFESDLTDGEKEDLRNTYHATVIKAIPAEDIELWELNLPFSLPDPNNEDNVFNINDITLLFQGESKKKAGVNEWLLNYQLTYYTEEGSTVVVTPGTSPYYDPDPSCFNQTISLDCNAGNKPGIKIGLVDSGMDLSLESNGMLPNPPDPNVWLNHTHTMFDVSGNTIKPTEDYHGHGTQMTSIVSGLLNNSGAIRNLYHFELANVVGNIGGAPLLEVIDGLSRMKAQGVHVVLLALGYVPIPGDNSMLLRNEIMELVEVGILPIISAGNGDQNNLGRDLSSYTFYPAGWQIDGTIKVASFSCLDGAISSFSNYGTMVHLAAPGEEVFCLDRNNQWVLADGTSHAAALVTGAAALLGAHQPNFDANAIICALENTVDPLPPSAPGLAWNGIINVQAALNYMLQSNCLTSNLVADWESPIIDEPEYSYDVVNDDATLSINVFPNPFFDQPDIRLNVPEDGLAQLLLYDAYGKLVDRQEVNCNKGSNAFSPDYFSSGRASGVYILKLQQGNQMISTKLVYQK